MINKLQHAFHELNEREQRIVLVGGIFLILYLFYLFIYSPLVNGIADKHHQLIEKKETLLLMESVQKKLGVVKEKEPLSKDKMPSAISKSLSIPAFKTWPYQLSQTTEGRVTLSFKEVPYPLLLEWLATFTATFHTTIEELVIEKTNTSGVVKATLLFS